jgi:hypothetical protein
MFNDNDRKGLFGLPVMQRSIGSVYEPEREDWANYALASLAHAYDMYLFVDKSTALSQISREYLNRPRRKAT